jgi:hypothetical protein
MLIALAANFATRHIIARRADAQEKRVTEEAYERAHFEEFVPEEDG